jgi:hypothetical protein
VAVAGWHAAAKAPAAVEQGLTYKIYAGGSSELPDFSKLQPTLSGASPDLQASAQGFTRYATTWDGLINIPADAGYTFHLIDRDGARLVIDGMEVAKTGPPFAQVCGSTGNALRYDSGSIGLRAGLHAIRVEALNTASEGPPRLMWESAMLPLADVPANAFSHPLK